MLAAKMTIEKKWAGRKEETVWVWMLLNTMAPINILTGAFLYDKRIFDMQIILRHYKNVHWKDCEDLLERQKKLLKSMHFL